MSVLNEARRLHEAGYDLIPLSGKAPITKGWTKAQRLGMEELEHDLEQGKNLGIRLGHEIADGRYIACVDVDVVGKLHKEEEKALKTVLDGLSLASPAAQVVTGFGNASKHLYVVTDSPAKTQILGKAPRQVKYLKGGSEKTGPVWSVELRGFGAQTVLPPSVHPDTHEVYKWKRGCKLNGAAELPFVSCDSGPTPSKPQNKLSEASQQSLHELSALPPLYRTILETGSHADYDSRSEALYAVLGSLVRKTKLSDEEIETLVLSYPLGEKAEDKPTGWIAAQCKKLRAQRGDALASLKDIPPGSSFEDMKSSFERAARTGMSPAEREEFLVTAKKVSGLRKSALEEELDSFCGDAVGQRARLAHGDSVYEEVCDRHALVSWAGKPAIFRKRIDPPSWESSFDIMTLSSLATFYENKPVMLGKKAANPIELWRADPARSEFLEGARLVPPDEDCPKGIFNLWQGFAFEPKRGSVEVWRDFVREVICSGQARYAAWLEDWIADAFQHPGQPPGVAIVMRGEEGIGKGTFASALGRIMGSHYRHVTQESQLTGRFNGHFSDSTLIYADELVWGGDKKNRGTLYALVTEKYLMVERKNFDAVPMRNLNRLLIASNNEWVVPTGFDGRRWYVLDVSNKFKGNTKYFNALKTYFNSGGYEAILQYYLTRKITHDLRIAPITKALIDQKVAGFDSITAWWHGVMERGFIRPPIGEGSAPWETQIGKQMLSASYQAFCADHGTKPLYWGVVVKRLHKLVPDLKETRLREGARRIQQIHLPELEECQAYFEGLLGHATD